MDEEDEPAASDHPENFRQSLEPCPFDPEESSAMAPGGSHSLSRSCPVFPPVNHEGLFDVFVPPLQNLDQSHPPFSPSPPPPPPFFPFSQNLPARAADDPIKVDPTAAPAPAACCSKPRLDVSGLLSLGLQLFCSKVFGAPAVFRHLAVVKKVILSFAPAAGTVAAALLCFMYVRGRRRWRRTLRERSIDYLISLIRERDEKILHLLYQISQMNEVLLDCNKSLRKVTGDCGQR